MAQEGKGAGLLDGVLVNSPNPTLDKANPFSILFSTSRSFLNSFSIHLNPFSIRLSGRARSQSRLPANTTNTEAMTKAFTAVTAASKLFSADAIF